MNYRNIARYKYELTGKHTAVTIPPGQFLGTDGPWVRWGSMGLITICEGYCWDGASGPAIDTPDFVEASLVHDAIYQILRESPMHIGDKLHRHLREVADRTLRKMCIDAGMPRWRAWYVYRAVRAFGASSARG